VCWGTDFIGQMSDFTTNPAPLTPIGDRVWQSVVAGGTTHLAGLSDGTLFCWGVRDTDTRHAAG
jgi:hypothetical protein